MSLKNTLLFVGICLSFCINAQKAFHYGCGANPTQQEIEYLDSALERIDGSILSDQRNVTTLPIAIWIIQDSTNSNIITEEQIAVILAEANAAYFPMHMEFRQCGAPQYIQDEDLYDLAQNEESALIQAGHIENQINFYIANSLVTSQGDTLCGYAKFPGGTDVIAMDKDCLLDGSTFVHELGHYFGLYHTHGTTNFSTSTELVNGLNCNVAGDDVCDTPADPNLRNLVEYDCLYDGDLLDANGDPYQPDPLNYMCYAPASCRSIFTDGQLERVKYVQKYLRDYLVCDELDLSYSVTETFENCDSTLNVVFNYTGSDPDAIVNWDIDGDGFFDYSGELVSHQYELPGQYDLVMEVTSNESTGTMFKESAIHIMQEYSMPLMEAFDLSASEIHISNPNALQTWFRAQMNPSGDAFSMCIDNYHNYNRGEEDMMELPPVILNGQTNAYLSFDIAYADYGAGHLDGLKVQLSTDCGENYNTLFHETGADLASVDYNSGVQWMPSGPEEWKNVNIDLTSYLDQKVWIRFVNINDFGNNLYIDNISLDGDPLLAHRLLSISGEKEGPGRNLIKYHIDEPEQIEFIRIEASLDGDQFQSIHDIDLSIAPQGEFIHLVNRDENRYYRLAGFEKSGVFITSELVFIPVSTDRMFSIVPNPAKDRTELKLGFEPNPKTSYLVTVHDYQGKSVWKRNYRFETTNPEIPIEVNTWPNGMYIASIEFEGMRYDQRFIKNE